MMRVGLSSREMVEALAAHHPPVIVSKTTVGDDRLVIRRRWIAEYTDDYGEHVAEVWSTFRVLLESVMSAAQQGDLAAVAEARKINTEMGRMVGAFLPDQLQIVGPGGGPIQVEHGISASAQIARGRSVLDRLLGSPDVIDVTAADHPNGNGSSNGSG